MIKDKRELVIEDENNIYYIFKGSKYFPLDNFYEDDIEVVYQGLVYSSSEAAFQSAKRKVIRDRVPFTTMDAATSKQVGRDKSRTRLRKDWNKVKDQIMYDIVKDKMERNPWIAELLLSTGDKNIEEGNTWGDEYWGVNLNTRFGENNLGIILMKIRLELQHSRDI